MTDQITVPRETWDAMREALEEIICAHPVTSTMRQVHAIVAGRAALTAANAVSAEPCPHCGAIHAKGMNTLCDDGEPVGINGLTEAETSASMPVMGLSKPTVQPQATDGLGLPLSCGGPLCAPNNHHPYCKLHVQPQAQGEAIAWEATTPVYTKYVTDKRYRSFSDAAKRWYKPYKCSSCEAQATEPASCHQIGVCVRSGLAAENHARLIECARRLVEHADFALGGILSADSKAKDIPSKAVSQVKSRHLAALRDALPAAPEAKQ